jgi:hypothetical protein
MNVPLASSQESHFTLESVISVDVLQDGGTYVPIEEHDPGPQISLPRLLVP